MHGIDSAVAAGIVAACPEKKLELLCALGESGKARVSEYARQLEIEIYELESRHTFDLDIEAEVSGESGRVCISDRHTNVVLVEQNGENVTDRYRSDADVYTVEGTEKYAKDLLNVEDIIKYAESVPLETVEPKPPCKSLSCR